ncbi:MAG TPA: type I-C CRISPR-associated protein Cas8c/Csd1 [Terriglobales bacterium]
MQKLYETYEKCAAADLPDAKDLLPIAHTTQRAHIEIVIDGEGQFRRAQLVQRDDPAQPCIVPATEKSAGRTSGEAAHALCDKIQYCAGDYESFGGTKPAYFASYRKQLSEWCDSPSAHPKAKAVLAYVSKAHVVSDLVRAGILVERDNRLVVYEKSSGKKNKDEEDDAPEIFKLLTPKKEGEKSVVEQGDAFVRWRIELPGDVASGTWEDDSLKVAWQRREASQKSTTGFCMVQGYTDRGEPRVLATQHPAKLRHGADKAKIISSNDTSGFTFLGRFTDAEQAAGVSFEVTQKAHNALRWLIGRKQAFRNGDQVVVAWAIGGQSIPDPWANSMDLLGDGVAQTELDQTEPFVGDVGQEFSRRLNRTIAGYRSNLSDTDQIVVMGLDSATPGRMAITFYRELKGSEFLQRIQTWHEAVSWPQNFGKNSKFVGAPAPRDIAEAAYGRRLDDKLKKATVERLLPCIIDGQTLPFDLVRSCARRTFNRSGMDVWEWEKCLGIACALYRGFHTERGYVMALEEGRKTRDYLYGRLLAVAEHLEGRALHVAGERRDTTASRLMQRFADHPYSTWRNIELALTPYKSRLRARRAAFLWGMEKLLDQLQSSFSTEDEKECFTNDRPLSGEFLLSYHCQRQALRPKVDDIEPTLAATLE